MMIFRIGIENNNDGRTIAWALEHPGCFAYGADATAALADFPAAARAYSRWMTGHGGDWLASAEDASPVAEETFEVSFVDREFELVDAGRGSMVESFFRYDWKPLTATDIERLLKLLAWSRAELLSAVQDLSPEQLSRTHPGERWDINGILGHVGSAEWWYQERIGFPFPELEDHLPSDPFPRLEMVRAHLDQLLPKLEGLNRVIGQDGELWSPRKAMRRTVWHERDHAQHIRKLL
jgi:hypothetical protein